MPLATINQIKPIYVSFPLPQAELAGGARGDGAGSVRVEALPVGDTGKPRGGQLTFFDNSIDATSGTIVVRATFDNPTERPCGPANS